MNPKVFKTLEFDKVAERLSGLAQSEKAKEYAKKLSPTTNMEKIVSRLKETDDAMKRLDRFGSVSFGGIGEIKWRRRLMAGGALSPSELLEIASLLGTTANVKRYGESADKDGSKDSIAYYFDELIPVEELRREIARIIISEEQIADDASSELRSIRRKMSGMNDKIRSVLSGYMTSARDYLQDPVITTRDGRYCIPVKAEYKSKLSGIVHDQSSSGQTLFIEPMAVVELNNDIRELELAEKKEIERILAVLSQKAADAIGEIDSDYRILTELDFIFAKGSLAQEMKACMPLVNTEGLINLKGARHPLIDKDIVVPVDVNLGITFDQLIITGPNTGGKTVSLKTVGLLTLMGQAGLLIPADPGSEISVFHNVYADIGDEQSIEQSLSTFSSHMTNIIGIMRSVEQSPNTALVLFDELCAGTDPAEGASLATSILKTLHTEGVKTMATTHYSELKEYALVTDGVENAACEFSVETLSPTYRLLIGVPGKSNAFAISKKLGLPQEIIDDAKQRMGDSERSFEDLMAELTERQGALERARESAARSEEVLKNREEKLHRDEAGLYEKRDRILMEAEKEAANILSKAKKEADETIREFRKMKLKSPDISEMDRKRTALGSKIRDAEAKSSAAMKRHVRSATGAVNVRNLHIGDAVRVIPMNVTGTIHKLPDAHGNLEVQAGIMHTRVNVKDIELIKEESALDSYRRSAREERTRVNHSGSFNKSAYISPEIKLIGMTRDEAITRLDKYIDDAAMSHLKEVRIVHGKGTGVLRAAVQEYLSGNPYVKSFGQAAFGEGDAGVTVAKLSE